MPTIDVVGSSVTLRTELSPQIAESLRSISGRKWDGQRRLWVFPLERLRAVLAAVPEAGLTAAAEAAAQREARASIAQPAGAGRFDYQFVTKPFDHQLQALTRAAARTSFALFMEMGTGKTKVAIDLAAWRMERGVVKRVLVVCPLSVANGWRRELATHGPPGTKALLLTKGSAARKRATMQTDTEHAWHIINYDAVPVLAKDLMARGPEYQMVVLDESSKIKNPSAKRTKALLALARTIPLRLILTGTPLTEEYLNVYPQFKFLDPAIIGLQNATAFKNQYAVMGGFKGRQVVGYRNIPDLMARVAPYTYQVLKEECLDIPTPLHEVREVEMAPEQRRVYEALEADSVAEFDGTTLAVPVALARLMRFQQITSGFFPTGEGNEVRALPDNPKVKALLEVVEEARGPFIVWSRFRPEVAMIVQALRAAGISCGAYTGQMSVKERTAVEEGYRDGSIRGFVGQIRAGGYGLDFPHTRTVIYCSQTWSYDDRAQSMARAHRAGTRHVVTYVDLVCANTVDMAVLAATSRKREMATTFANDIRSLIHGEYREREKVEQ